MRRENIRGQRNTATTTSFWGAEIAAKYSLNQNLFYTAASTTAKTTTNMLKNFAVKMRMFS